MAHSWTWASATARVVTALFGHGRGEARWPAGVIPGRAGAERPSSRCRTHPARSEHHSPCAVGPLLRVHDPSYPQDRGWLFGMSTVRAAARQYVAVEPSADAPAAVPSSAALPDPLTHEEQR